MKTPLLLILATILLLCSSASGIAKPEDLIRITVLGDSLVAGYGLVKRTAFPQRLEVALQQRGYHVEIYNAGVSGDTSAGGLARLDWTLADKPDLIIVELGANDALRGLAPLQTRQNLTTILSRLRGANVQALLVGMKAPRNLGEDYFLKFDRLYPELAREHQVPFYPFFLEGVVGRHELNQADGIHPTAAGVDVIVHGILPLVEETLKSMRR